MGPNMKQLTFDLPQTPCRVNPEQNSLQCWSVKVEHVEEGLGVRKCHSSLLNPERVKNNDDQKNNLVWWPLQIISELCGRKGFPNHSLSPYNIISDWQSWAFKSINSHKSCGLRTSPIGVFIFIFPMQAIKQIRCRFQIEVYAKSTLRKRMLVTSGVP